MIFDIIRSGGFNIQDIIASIISSLIVIFLCLPFHEFAHAFIADRLGDRTARGMGRLTVNPLAHIDWLGALMIILVGFGYAKPVPINQFNLRRPKRDTAFIALAGPVANILMAFVLLLLGNVVLLFARFVGNVAAFVYVVCYYAAMINCSLAVFNLIPVPPLDGSRILFAFASDRVYYKLQQYENLITVGLFLLIASGVFERPILFVVTGILNGLSAVADLPFNLIGFFLK